MSDEDGRPTITPVVRQYSLTINKSTPDDAISQALGSVVKTQDDAQAKAKQQAAEWNKWLQFGESPDDDVLSPLENQRKELVETWKDFGHLFHSEDELARPPDSLPTIETLRGAIHQAQDVWLAKKAKGFGKAKDRFFDFLDTMNDHSYLFKVIPSGDKYVSLVTGVVASVVKASTNHKKIAEGFSMALVDISSDLHFVTKSVGIADSQEMRRLVVELYVGVFKLLCHAMNWFKRRKNRFFSALNKNFYDDTVQELVNAIQKTVQRVRDESQFIANGRVGRIEDMVDSFFSLRVVGSQSRNDDVETTRQKLDRAREGLGYSSVRTLESVEQRLVHEQSGRVSHKEDTSAVRHLEVSPARDSGSESFQDDEVNSVSGNDFDELCFRHEIERLLRPIDRYLEDGREDVSLATLSVSSSILPEEVLIQLQMWIQAPESRMIWVGGDPVAPYGSGLSRSAMRLCTVSKEAELPCVSFFCKPRYDFTSAPDVSDREASLIALLYSVIAQLTYLLPTEFRTTKDLDADNFRLLDGTMDSVTVALCLIRALLVYAPPSLIWVLDGLQLAETPTTTPHLIGLMEILRDQETQRISKVCFTTDGNSYVLMKSITAFERVDASRMAQGRSARHLAGGRDIVELGGPGWRGM